MVFIKIQFSDRMLISTTGLKIEKGHIWVYFVGNDFIVASFVWVII
jgi:hypothetical protein